MKTVVDALVKAGWSPDKAQQAAPRIATAAAATAPRHGERRHYLRHRRRGEDACEECRAAHREYVRQWRANRAGSRR